jgi:dephospho-CoA kinase
MDDETKRSRADFVILNDGQIPLIPQVEELIERLRNGD